MLFTRLPEKKYLLGIDMGETGCQISYLNTRRLSADMDPHTFSRARSGEAYEIPYAAADGWQEREGLPDPGSSGTGTDHEAGGVRTGDMQTELAATENYLRYCLYCLRREVLPEEIEAVTFTAAQMDELTSSVLEGAVRRILPGLDHLRFEEHIHSFYHYVLMQDDEQRRDCVMLVDGTAQDQIRVVTLSFNKKTRPIVCVPDETVLEAPEGGASGAGETMDEALAALTAPMIRARKYSAAYLTGSLLHGGWMKKAADVICRGRRAFQGENLFSKGAAYSAMIACGLASRAGRYYYLGMDALRCHFGIKCRQKSREICRPMLEAGTDWYDARASVDVIAEGEGEITILQTALDRGSSREITVTLENFPQRPPRTTRLRLTLSMRTADTMLIEAEDLGFGEIYPSSGMKWEQEIGING